MKICCLWPVFPFSIFPDKLMMFYMILDFWGNNQLLISFTKRLSNFVKVIVVLQNFPNKRDCHPLITHLFVNILSKLHVRLYHSFYHRTLTQGNCFNAFATAKIRESSAYLIICLNKLSMKRKIKSIKHNLS